MRTFWGRPEQDFWLVGHGQACVLGSDEAGSIDRIAEEHRALVQTGVIEAPAVRGVGPLFMGGFRYDPHTARDVIWKGFPDALMVLPRFLFTWSKGAGWLTTNVMVAPETDPVRQGEALMDELQSLDTRPAEQAQQPATRDVTDLSYEEWASRVRNALKAVESGLLTKVVLARKKVLHAGGRYSLENALELLCRTYPGCTVFAIDNGQASFVGASPETLAHVAGRRLSLTCLASSAARGSNPEEDCNLEKQLVASSKEQREHEAVVAMLAASLRDVCTDLKWESRPQVWKLRNVQHLLTPFTGNLGDCYGVLDIVRRLHPTPAVAGVPTDRALRLIRDTEGDRGWYAAPVGWLDHTLSGEFVVAIRSALLRGDRAVLYAGAGIIDGSDPEQEFRETEMKFQPMLAALGGG
ncbi:MAG: isochorismate synthase [bacterium]|nr:isochorismate synthase [bacterium]